MDNNIQEQMPFPFVRLLKANVILIAIITAIVTTLSVLYNVFFVSPVYTVSRSVILRTELNDNFSTEEQEATNAALAKDLVIVQMEQHFKSPKYVQLANKIYKDQNKNSQSTITSDSINVTYNAGSLIFKTSIPSSTSFFRFISLLSILKISFT